MMRRRRSFLHAASFAIAMASMVAGSSATAADKTKKAAADSPKLDAIDEMVREGWKEANIKPSRPANDAEFLRRAYLDVLGRIPTIEEAGDFLGRKDNGKRAKLVDHLLAHPDYAKNLAVQYRVLLIGRKRQERMVKPEELENWLRREFASNRPWDQMAHDLIAAKGSNKENGAVNYTMAHLEGGAVPLTSLTTRVFLGQQIQCTQCHDHPSNDWKQGDFWGINAFFKGVKTKEVRTTDSTGGQVTDYYELSDMPSNAYSTFERRNAEIRIAFPTFLDGRKISQGKDVDRRESLAGFICDPANADFAKAFVNRTWARFFGRGFVFPVDDFGPHNPPSNPDLLDQLARDFAESKFDIKALSRRIMLSEAYNLSSVTTPQNKKDDTLFSHMALKPMSPEQLFESLLVATAAHKTGSADDSTKRRDQWLGQFVFAFANDEGEEGSSFQGTIPQALMMMNGDLMERAVGGRPGSFLCDLLDEAKLQVRTPIPRFVVERIYVAALSRPPTPGELNMAGEYLSNYPDTIPVMEDIFWALLNSNEFILCR